MYGVFKVSEFNGLKRRLMEYLTRRAPGVLDLFNIYCMLIHRVDCVTLLFTSPSKLYHIVLTHYRGDIVSTDYAFTLAFLGPIAILLGRVDIVKELLNLVKTGRDSEFLELLAKYVKSSAM
jgi:hypothetical protein